MGLKLPWRRNAPSEAELDEGLTALEKTAVPVPVRAVPFRGLKASATGSTNVASGPPRAVFGGRETGALTRAGYLGNPVGYRAVKLVAEAAAALPLVCQDRERRYERHPVLALIERPNAGQGRADLLEALYAQMLLSGNGFVEAVGIEALPQELHVLRSDRMSVVPGPDGWPVAYDYSVGAKKHRFDVAGDASPICHLKQYHPTDDHYGLSPFVAASASVEVHNAASKWSRALLDNAARPSGAIIYQGEDGATLSAEQYERLLSEMETHHQGARNAGRPMLLEGGLDWKPMGFSPSDMEFQQTKEAAAREIVTAFGVPPMLMGIPGDATYANYQEANRAFYRLTVLPLANRVLAALSHWLAQFGGEDAVELKPDLDQVPALGPEREAAWRRIASADFLSASEKRSLLGLPAQMEGEA